MKTISNFFWILLSSILVLLFSTCEKDSLNDNSISGKKWILNSGRLYLEELDAPFNKLYFDHFGDNKNLSSLQAFDSFSLSIDSIYQYSTTWEFNARFVLNGKFSYDFEITNGRFYRIYGLENGSARILEYISGNNTYIIIRDSGGYGSLNGKNIKWFSELLFTNNGITCNNCLIAAIGSYQYSGVVPKVEPPTNSLSLIGTRWLLEKYKQGFFVQQINDTITFKTLNKFSLNSNPNLFTYSLSGSDALGLRNFTLYEYSSLPSGTPAWTGKVNSSAIQEGLITLEMKSYSGTLEPIQIFMKKI